MANMNLKKKFLSIAILACILGIALTAIGSATGGFNDLINSTKNKLKATKTEESFSEISSLTVNLAMRNLVVDESSDDNIHLSYYQHDHNYQINNDTFGKLTVNSENGKLNLREENSGGFRISSGIQSLLNLFSNEYQEKNVVYLTLPKGTKLETFSSSSSLGDITLSNLSANNTEITLSKGNLTINNSQFLSSKIRNALGDITLNNSQISSGEIKDSSGNIGLNNSHFGTGEITAALGDINLNSSKISDTSLKISSGSISSKQLDLVGNISITNQLGDINLQLVPNSLNKLSFDLKTTLGDIDIPNGINVEYTKDSKHTGSTLVHKIENPTATLTITAKSGNIKLNE